MFVLLIINLYFFAIIGMLTFPRFYEVFDKGSNGSSSKVHKAAQAASTFVPPSNDRNSSVPIISDKKFEKNHVFDGIKNSLINLMILLTTSNNPDVMLQAYSQNRLAGLFYILYLVIGKK